MSSGNTRKSALRSVCGSAPLHTDDAGMTHANALDALVAAGISEARALGGEPILVVEDVVPVAASGVGTSVLLKGLSDSGAGESPDQSRNVLVFPGPADRLREAIAQGRIPLRPWALVVEDGEWKQVYVGGPAQAGTLRSSRPAKRFVGAPRLARKLLLGMAQRLRSNRLAHRLQPILDRRASAIIAALGRADDFPFRFLDPVERRVVLGLGQLGGGGAERQIVNTAEGLASRGITDVHILLIGDDAEQGVYYEKAMSVCAGIHATGREHWHDDRWIAAHPEWHELVSADLMNRILNAASVIAQLRPSVVQISLDWPNIVVGMAAVLCGVRHVLISGRNLAPHHFEFFQWFMYPCYRALLAQPSVVMTNNSDAGRDSYARWLNASPDSIQVIRNGLQTDEFPLANSDDRARIRQQLGIAADAPVIAGAFRLSSEKRPLLWIEAAAQVRKALPSAVFLLCGDGKMRDEIKARAVALGLDANLRMLGSRPDIFAIFSAADVVMQSALQEGTPNTLIEAQAMGLPVVTTRAFGAAEAVADGSTGVVVQLDTAQALADATLAILTDRAFGERACIEGPAWIGQRFGFERMIDDTLAVYAFHGVPWATQLLSDERLQLKLSPVGEQENCWCASLPQLRRLSDDETSNSRSRIKLLENGRELGPPHSAHQIIRQEGRGAFSHWKDRIYFSTSDNSSPFDNGRCYEIAIPRDALHR